MPYLLDTVVLSASRRPERQDRSFQASMAAFDADDSFLSAVSIVEIRLGIQKQERRDPPFAAALANWLNKEVLPGFQGRILPFDEATALLAGALPEPNLEPTPDVMIAATALQHGLQVVTRNVADFERLGVACIDPWRYAPG